MEADSLDHIKPAIRDLLRDFGLTEYFPDKLTIEAVHANLKQRVVTKQDIPWVFLDNVINPCYDGRSVYFEGQDDASDNDEDDWCSDWPHTNHETMEKDFFLFDEVAGIVFSCCDYDCKEFLAQMLQKSLLSSPIILPDFQDSNNVYFQTSVLRGITGDVDNHVPVVSFVSVSGNGTLKTDILNSMLADDHHMTFENSDAEASRIGIDAAVDEERFQRMGRAEQKNIFIDGGIPAIFVKKGAECICAHQKKCSCSYLKDLIFLNVGRTSDTNKQTQEELISEISTLVTVFVDSGTLHGNIDTISKVKSMTEKSKHTLVVLTNGDEAPLEHCKRGFEELKDAITGTDTQVVITYNRKHGGQDNLDLIRGWMRMKINTIMEVVDVDEEQTLREMIESVNVPNVIFERF